MPGDVHIRKALRWVFIRPECRSFYYDPEVQEPLGIEYLAAGRKSAGDAVLLLDSVLDNQPDTRIGRRAAAFEPDIIGFSITTAQELESVRAIYTAAGQALGSRTVRWVAGGNFVSSEPDHARQLLPEEFLLVCYEGEHALDLIAEGYTGTACIKGKPVGELDSLAFPTRDFARQLLNNAQAFNVSGSRGCCGACRYCASPGMTGHGRNVQRWRGRSAENIVAELKSLVTRYGARDFCFTDEDFIGPPATGTPRVLEFCRLIGETGLDITFAIQVRPVTFTPELVQPLVDAGLVYVFMGIESDNPDDFRRWGRQMADDPWTVVRRVQQCGAEISAGVLLFHPHSTLNGIDRFARKLDEHKLLNYRTATNRLDAMPGSQMYIEARNAGVIRPDVTGMAPLPFKNFEIGQLHEMLLYAAAPLGPVSMHALCQIPRSLSLLRRKRCDGETHGRLIDISQGLDKRIAHTLWALLDGTGSVDDIRELSQNLRDKNLIAAEEACRDLADCGFADSYEQLRHAVELDAGV